MGFSYDEINIFYSNLAQSTPQVLRRLLSTFILKTVNLTKRNREKTSFFGKNLRSEYGYQRPREASPAAIAAPKSHAITFLTPWGHVGRGRWLWSGQIHLPWPSRALKMGKKIVDILALRCSLRQPCGKFAGRCRRPQRRSKAPQTQQDMQERIGMHS